MIVALSVLTATADIYDDLPFDDDSVVIDEDLIIFNIIGDVNSDYNINMMDVTDLQKFIVRLITIIDRPCADVDGNGKINMVDVTLIQKYMAQLIEDFSAVSLGNDLVRSGISIINNKIELCSDSEDYYTITYPEVSLSDEIKEIYPDFAVAMTKFNTEYYDSAMSCKDDFDKNLGYFEENKDPFYCTRSLELSYADRDIVSFFHDGTYYIGGSHVLPMTYGYTFSTHTGRKLKLSNVVADMDAMPKVLCEVMDEKYPNILTKLHKNETLLTTLKGFHSKVESGKYSDYIWCMNDDGVTIIFLPRYIAPYESGTFTAEIKYEDYPEIFYSSYLK